MLKYNIGSIFGNFTIVGTNSGEAKPYIVVCKCGALLQKRATDLIRAVVGCQKCRSAIFAFKSGDDNQKSATLKAAKANRKAEGEAALTNLLYKYKKNAKDRNFIFLLTKEQFKALTSSNCYYCGAPPNQSVNKWQTKRFNGDYLYNGIDRKANNEGYTIGNSLPCCKQCNFLKSSLSYDFFITHIMRIAAHITTNQ